MEPCYVIRSGKRRNVKNLGWLLANWREVADFEIRNGNCLLATLKSDPCDFFFAEFAGDSAQIHQFLDRPVFRGLRVNDNGNLFTV